MIKFLVKNQNIETLEHEIIADNQVAFVNIKFVFDNNWKPLHKVVQFTQDEENFFRVLGIENTACDLPAELHAGSVKMSLFGYDTSSAETVRATTIVKTLNIRPSGFDIESVSNPPTSDLYQQILQQISDGKNGESAYEIAVKNGFSGTEKEWILSLKGADGKNGKSAYEIAVESGFVGSEQEWLESLKNADFLEIEKIITEKIISENGDISADLQEIKNKVAFLESAAHSHKNLDFLDGLTAEKIADSCNPDTTEFELKLQSLRDDFMDYKLLISHRIDEISANISNLESEIQQLADSTKYERQIQEDKILYLENRIVLLENKPEKPAKETVLFNAEVGEDIFDKNILLLLNNGTYSLISFCEQYPEFCNGNTGYCLNYGYNTLGWGVSLLTASGKSVNLYTDCKIAIEYKAGANLASSFYLVSAVGRDSKTPVADFIFSQIKAKNCVILPFEWVYSSDFITTITACTGIQDGDYYVAWSGTSDNSHPLVKSVKILGG